MPTRTILRGDATPVDLSNPLILSWYTWDHLTKTGLIVHSCSLCGDYMISEPTKLSHVDCDRIKRYYERHRANFHKRKLADQVIPLDESDYLHSKKFVSDALKLFKGN